MSIIAKSLKKIKTQDKSKEKQPFYKAVAFSNSKYFIAGFYGIILLFLLLLTGFGINYYFFVKKNNNITNFKIEHYEKIYYATVNQFQKMKTANKNEIKLKYFLTMNNFEELKELLEKIKLSNEKIYLKYFGILCFKQKDYKNAIKNLSLYIKKYKFDRDVLSYLGNIYYIQNNFSKAIEIYNKISDDNFETAYNKAIIYEKIGDLKNSLKFYQKSYSLVQDPLLKKRIYNKIFLMENYESKKN